MRRITFVRNVNIFLDKTRFIAPALAIIFYLVINTCAPPKANAATTHIAIDRIDTSNFQDNEQRILAETMIVLLIQQIEFALSKYADQYITAKRLILDQTQRTTEFEQLLFWFTVQ